MGQEKRERTVQELVSRIQEARRGRPAIPVSVLWGAGASVPAGIPDALKMMSLIASEYPLRPGEVPPQTYSEAMGRLEDPQQRAFIRKHVTSPAVNVNWAHVALAELLENDWVQYVLSVNF